MIWISLGNPDAGVVDLAWDDDKRYRRVHSEVSEWRASPIQIMEMLLAEPVSPDSEITADVPFVVHSMTGSDDTAVHRRLLSCTPVDSRSSLVTVMVWTTSTAEADDPTILDQMVKDLEGTKSAAEEQARTAAPQVTGAVPGDEDAVTSEWKRRLTDLGSGGR
ncbi:hypothetical protein ORI20_26025 [Mycobacterium sp. CVI_P3]|uniref:Uncharacterized protein n=1 Tax=Mycobacterium pinniadriaticum TaxID=2994102 RepID=A0ABT3SKV0_9MYCO|nr:hypothetical protein [Mycobacterium pinniadriaticum]MCX2933733.1 hypothetical protein [Mycobacterium pinniadriaticum]MCX2940155.1 hypothetical protein [Mycobacterium pinniadriaticum]